MLKNYMAHQWLGDIEKNKAIRAANKARDIENDLKRIEFEKSINTDDKDKEIAKK